MFMYSYYVCMFRSVHSVSVFLSWGIPVVYVTERYNVRKSNTTSLLTEMLLLIERHVSAYSEVIIRFYDC